ncbi:hypothetical protein CCP3SC1AL1_420005 [Gammaproteobacteria bacterium]
MRQNENINLLQKVLESVSRRGYKKTLDLLSFKVEDNVVLRKTKDKLIIAEVIKAFNISKDDLFLSRYERGELKYAIGFCVHYLYKYKTLGEIYKTIFKNKNKAQLSKYRQLIVELNPKIEQDKKYITLLETLNTIIEK